MGTRTFDRQQISGEYLERTGNGIPTGTTFVRCNCCGRTSTEDRESIPHANDCPNADG